MTEQERAVIAAQLWATRAAIDAALVTLGELVSDAPVTTSDDDCTHPMEMRDDLTTMGGPLEWRCRRCGYHSITTD